MPDVSFAAPGTVIAALAQARSVDLCAYTLAPRGAVAAALEAAGDRGADVHVTLEAFADRDRTYALRREARATAAALEAHGVHVRLGLPDGGMVHLKAAVIDGTAYLDDRNWTAGGETIVADARPADVAVVRDAIGGRTVATATLATEKDAALLLESAAIGSGTGDRVDVESESFGASVVSASLRARAAAGAHVRLLVNGNVAFAAGSGRERAVLRSLAAQGVEIRTTPSAEKLCVAGDRGWVGSANPTFDRAPTTDWGLALSDAAMLAPLEAAFERTWRTARAFA
jgi:hypothetical protein